MCFLTGKERRSSGFFSDVYLLNPLPIKVVKIKEMIFGTPINVSFNHVLRFLGTTLTLNKDSARDGTELRNCEGKTVRIWQKPELGERQVS